MEPTHGGPRWRLPVLTPLVAALLLVLLAVPAPPVRVAFADRLHVAGLQLRDLMP